jgi:hypothetical protein
VAKIRAPRQSSFEETLSTAYLHAFYDIDCGKDPYGIFSMVHTEGLHALEIGVIKYRVEILMKELLPTAQHGKLNGVVKNSTTVPASMATLVFQGVPGQI